MTIIGRSTGELIPVEEAEPRCTCNDVDDENVDPVSVRARCPHHGWIFPIPGIFQIGDNNQIIRDGKAFMGAAAELIKAHEAISSLAHMLAASREGHDVTKRMHQQSMQDALDAEERMENAERLIRTLKALVASRRAILERTDGHFESQHYKEVFEEIEEVLGKEPEPASLLPPLPPVSTETIQRLIRYSYREAPLYNTLTEEERQLISEEDFNKLRAWAFEA